MATVKNEEDALYRGHHNVIGGVQCTYPSCKFKSIDESPPYVIWHGSLDLDLFYTRVPPIVKLAMQEHFDSYQQENKFIYWDYFFHPECAAEWGMQLIRDAIDVNPDVGRILSGRNHSEV